MDSEKLKRFQLWKAEGIPQAPDQRGLLPGSMLEKRSPSPLFPLDDFAAKRSFDHFMGRIVNSDGRHPDFYLSYVEFQNIGHQDIKTKIFLSDLSFLRGELHKSQNESWDDNYYFLGVSFLYNVLKEETKPMGIDVPKIGDAALAEYFYSLFGKTGSEELAAFKAIVDRDDPVNLPMAAQKAVIGNIRLPGFVQALRNYPNIRNQKVNEFKRREFNFGLKHMAPLKAGFGKNWDAFEEGIIDMYGLIDARLSGDNTDENYQGKIQPLDLSFLGSLPEAQDLEAKRREAVFAEQEVLSSFLEDMALLRQLTTQDTFKISAYESGAYYGLKHLRLMAEGKFPVLEQQDVEAYFGDLIDAGNNQYQIRFLKEKMQVQTEDKDNPQAFIILFQRGVRDYNFTQLLRSFVERSQTQLKSTPKHAKDEYYAKSQGLLGPEGLDSFLMGFVDVAEIYKRWQQNQRIRQFRQALPIEN